MNFIKNLSIRTKLLAISLLPLLVLLFFLGQNLAGQIRKKADIKIASDHLAKTEKIGEVIHQFQQEREFSLAYFLSQGTDKRSELFAQRERTDQAIADLNQQVRPYGKINGSIESLHRIPDLRSSINALVANPDSVRIAFGKASEQLINEMSKTFLMSESSSIKNLLNTQLLLLYAEERLGQVRAIGLQTMLGQGFGIENYGEFSALKGKFETNLAQYRSAIHGEMANVFDEEMSSPAMRRALGMMDSIYHNPGIARLPFSRDQWWSDMTTSLGILQNIHDRSTLSIRALADKEVRLTNAAILRNVVFAVTLVALIIILLVFTIRSILASIQQLQVAAQHFAQGNIEVSLGVDSQDEIGKLAESFQNMIGVIREYASTADAIGEGNYNSVVQVRGTQDILGIALRKMQNSLIRLAKDNQDRTWLLTGASQLNDKMRGEKNERQLAQEVISQLTNYLKGQIGAIYLPDGDKLVLTGTYAFHRRKENTSEIAIGQGLVGQAALEKKPIVFSNVPDDYVQINSALGSTAPKSLVVYPFFYQNELKGIIEIGFAGEFSDLDMQLLNMVAENVGIAINSVQARTKMSELLEVTQQQAEELEVQQEELRQSNEELTEKTTMLQQSEAELRVQQEELEQLNVELEEKANLLEEQKERLEMANVESQMKAQELELTGKYKSEFLANMSHELRTPLNSILILSQLMAENKSQSLGEKEVQFAKNIYSSGSDLLNLINEILDLSKVEAGKIELEIAEVQMSQVAVNLRTTFAELAKSKSIEFDIHYPANRLISMETDTQRLEQILKNLLSNAFKFTGKGGEVILTIDTGAPSKLLRNPKLRQLEKVVRFAVRDSGIGIPEAKRTVIFEAFQQADGTTKRKYGGTGLGLSISRELANALGGEITLQSEEGKGSTFTLHLPLTFNAAIAMPGEKNIDIRRAGAPTSLSPGNEVSLTDVETGDDRDIVKQQDRKVLIIEDDPVFAQVLLDFVRERGYKGVVAHLGTAGLSLARQHAPDAILLDMGLPNMDGAEVLRQLKMDPTLRHIPVQIISGYDRRKESLELGAFDFVKKPLSKNDFHRVFERLEEFISRKLKKLLIVEDNRAQSDAILELIGNGDVKCYTAYSGEQAIAWLQKENFDCAIIDLGLPDMSGFELLEKIKTTENIKRVPVIVYTASDLSKAETQQLNKLANTVVLKTANSRERLLDETTLFLHRVESRLPEEKQQIIRKLHRSDEILKHKKVLVVDDDIRNIYSLTNVLEDEEMQCFTAENGKAALQVLKEQPHIDLILMDVMMPEMDGYEATREIRSHPEYKKLPIIALTAKAMKGDREKCMEAGMSDYIAKPVNVEQLLSLMRVWLY